MKKCGWRGEEKELKESLLLLAQLSNFFFQSGVTETSLLGGREGTSFSHVSSSSSQEKEPEREMLL